MKFEALLQKAPEGYDHSAAYKAARTIGVVRLGEDYLYFRKGFKAFYVSYHQITRCYRRVLLVPARMCCGRGDLAVENLVLEKDNQEIAEVQLPGTRAAKELINVLKERMPEAEFTCPPKKENKEEST